MTTDAQRRSLREPRHRPLTDASPMWLVVRVRRGDEAQLVGPVRLDEYNRTRERLAADGWWVAGGGPTPRGCLEFIDRDSAALARVIAWEEP